MKVIDTDAVHQARQTVKRALARTLEQEFRRLYQTHHLDEAGRFDAEAVGRRRLKNVCLAYLGELETEEAYRLSVRQFRDARTMTDQISALSTIVNSRNPEKTDCLAEFYEHWREEDLVIDKWFTLQATCRLPGTLDRVKELLSHPAFDLKTPNRVRSLIGAFSQANPVNFHVRDGAGYAFLADHVIALNALNPQVAARMLTALTPWRRYDTERQQSMRQQLQRIAGIENVSKDVYEVAMKSLS
jgi:aminopeptidase N